MTQVDSPGVNAIRDRLSAARRASWRHPRWLLALKTALAAALAWLLVQPVGGFVDDYPYYAPLGAVVGMATTIAGSLRTAARAVGAVVIGAAVGVTMQALPLPEPVAIAAAVGGGTLIAGWRWLGDMASWVPFVALFVLIVGDSSPFRYAGAYGGLVAFGALVAVVVNAALPQLPLTPATMAQDRLRRQLADQLDLLADGLESERVLTREEWEELRLGLDPQARQVQSLAAETAEARRGNWVARRWAEETDRRYHQARALQRLTGCVDEVIALVADEHTGVHGEGPTAAQVRAATTTAFRGVAAMLRSADQRPDDEEAGTSAAREAAEAVRGLREAAARVAGEGGAHHLAAAAIAVSLDQAVDAWT